MKTRRNLALLAILLAPLFAAACGTTYSSPPPEYPPRADMEGPRYETMRGLAGRLVNRLDATRDELRATRNREAETPLFGDLLEQARRFRDKLQDNSNPPRYVRADVDEIDRLAREYDAQTRNAVWYYPQPKDAAKQIQDRVAFWKDVKVTE